MACGLTGKIVHPQWAEVTQDLRAWPSAGAMYPIEVYLAPLEQRNWIVPSTIISRSRTASSSWALARTIRSSARRVCGRIWPNAAGLLILTGVFERTQIKYGERGYRFVLLDAGHLAQNILLACEDLRLAAVPLGGFHDDAVGNGSD